MLKPDVSAPGVAIVSARAHGTTMGTVVDDLFIKADGTSFATPCVSGIVAQMLGGFLAQGEKLTPRAVKARLMARAEKVGDPGDTRDQGTGRVDALRAYAEAAPPPEAGDSRMAQPPAPSPEPTDPSPCTHLLLKALADPFLGECLAAAKREAYGLTRKGGRSEGVELLAQAAEQFAASLRRLQPR